MHALINMATSALSVQRFIYSLIPRLMSRMQKRGLAVLGKIPIGAKSAVEICPASSVREQYLAALILRPRTKGVYV